MTSVRTVLGAVLTAAVVLASAGPVQAVAAPVGERSTASVQPTVRTGWQERMLARVNAVRAEAGSRPLRICRALTRSAESYAHEMSRDNRFGHVGADGSTADQRIAAAGYVPALVGENLAAGQPTVAEVMGAWRRSPTHYAAMTDPRFRHVGFGYAAGRSLRYDTFWVQHYGAGGSCR